MHDSYRSVVLICAALLCFFSSAFGQQVAQAPSVPLIQPEELAEIQSDTDVVILDTRSPEEYQQEHLKNARFVGYKTFKVEDVADISKEKKIIVYCKDGNRSEKIANQLIKAGYKRVKSLQGGIEEWKEQGYQTIYE